MPLLSSAGRQAIAFVSRRLIASGPLVDVAMQAKAVMDQDLTAQITVFDLVTSEPIDLDWRGDEAAVAGRLTRALTEETTKGRGRPKLGVVAREVTLLPRHWTWLARQPGGASAALRRLVDQSRQTHREADEIREARQSTYRFITAMAGDEPGYEEATRALFAGDAPHFRALMQDWPPDVKRHAETLAAAGVEMTRSPSASWMPQGCETAFQTALMTAFGAAPIQAAAPLIGGASSAKLWRLRVNDADVVLRLEGASEGLNDPARHFICLKIAADLGVAPKLLHADSETGVSISAFIEAAPAVPPLSRSQRLEAISQSLARLHAGPRFPKPLDYLDAVAGLLDAFARRGVLPASIGSDALAGFARIAEAYPRDPFDLVSSHNDLNPSNVIFDGDRPFIVDWQSAFAAPRYVDLAALATFLAIDGADETLILWRYFDAPPTDRQRARFYLMRQVSRLFYGVMLLTAAEQERPTRLPLVDVQSHTLEPIRDQMADLGRYETRIAFGCAFFNEAVQSFQTPAFAACLMAAG